MSCPSWGCTPRTLTLGFFDLRKRPVPVIVPQVPRPATKCVIFPWVCFQISGPVVRKCASGFAGFLYWLSWCHPGCLPMSAAFAMAPSGAPGIGQSSSLSSTSFAPKRRSACRFSAGTASDSVAVNPTFLAFASIASPMPVLPEVGSTSCSNRMPFSSASRSRLAATRSLTAPKGLYHSNLAYTWVCLYGVTRLSFTMGVGLSTFESISIIEP